MNPKEKTRTSIALAVLVAAFSLSATAHAQQYVVVELPPVSSFGARAWDLNNTGAAVGHGLSPTLQQHALLWPGTGVVDLTPTNPLAEAQGISENGSMAGWARNASGNTEAVRWLRGVPTFLGTLPGHIGSFAHDINDAGLVIGWSVTPVGDPVASVWTNGNIQAIGGTFSWAFAVSENGDVVGRRWVGVDVEGFRWRNGQLDVLPDLGPNHAQGTGISPNGWIAGAANSPQGNGLHAVVWDPNLNIRDLGQFAGLQTSANDVNDAGVAVGGAHNNLGEVILALVWRGAGPENLNTLIPPGTGWNLVEAQAVNDRGEIIGTGIKNGFGGDRSFLLRPDCDGDAISDIAEIAAGTAHDANQDQLADACQHCQEDLGFGGPGAMQLSVCGDELVGAGSAATVLVTGVPLGQPVFLVAGATNQPTPVLGGVLVPVPPDLVIAGLFADANGTIAFPVSGVTGPEIDVFLQMVVKVGPQTQFSNAVHIQAGGP